jgi:hypothetical protein
VTESPGEISTETGSPGGERSKTRSSGEVSTETGPPIGERSKTGSSGEVNTKTGSPCEASNATGPLGVAQDWVGKSNLSEEEYSSDSTDDEQSDEEEVEEETTPLHPGLDYSWTNEVVREEQDNDDAISRVRDCVERGVRPPSGDLEAESQEFRQSASRWTELEVPNGILVRMRLGKAQAVLPHNLRQVVFRHMHASPLRV